MMTMIALIVSLASGLSEGDMKGVEVIATVLGAVASLAGALFSPLEAVSKMSTSIFGPSVSEAMGAVVAGISQLLLAIAVFLPVLISQLITIAKGITEDPETLKPKMDLIGTALGAVSDFASAIGAVTQLMPDASLFDGGTAGRIGDMGAIISAVVGQVKLHMPGLIAAIVGIDIPGDPETVKAKIDVIGAAMTAVSQFADTISQLGEMAMVDGTAMGSLIQNMVVGIKASLTGENGLQGLFTALGGVTLDESALAPLTQANAALEQLTTFGANIIKMQEKMSEVPGGGMAIAVLLMVAEAKLAIEALNTLGEIDASVALENFAQAIGTGNSEFTVSNEPVNITINMTVTMDADKIGKVLIDKSVMTTPLTTAG